jgi:WD40 repeat protein
VATAALIGQPLQHKDLVLSASFSPDGGRLVTASADKTARLWKAPPVAPPNIVATAYKMLGDHETAGLSTRYGIDVKEPICMRDAPAAGLG